MRPPHCLLIIALLASLSACTTNRFANTPLPLALDAPDWQPRTSEKETLVLRALGEPGQGFAGTLVVDGVAQEVSGITPFERRIEASVLIGDLHKRENAGTLQFEIQSPTGLYRAGLLRFKGSRLRFGYHDSVIEVRTLN